MYRRPPSHLAADRGSQGLRTIPSAIAVLALAGLVLAACSGPAAGHNVPVQRTSDPPVVLPINVAATVSSPLGASAEWLRREHLPNAATSFSAPAGDSRESLRQEHLPNAAQAISGAPGDSRESLRQEHRPGAVVSGS